MSAGSLPQSQEPETREIHFITIHPAAVAAWLKFGIFSKASRTGRALFRVHDLRKFATDKHGTIDGRPYGGGDGMVFRPEPLKDAIQSLPDNSYVVHLSPSGHRFSQKDSLRLSSCGRPLVMICSRFGGTDQRFLDLYTHEELSVGDYVISGGELAALTVADAIVRHFPGSLGNEHSSRDDSFASGMEGMLEYPQYTRPETFEGLSVPRILLSGHHEKISSWRRQESLRKTRHLRPDLIPSGTSE